MNVFDENIEGNINRNLENVDFQKFNDSIDDESQKLLLTHLAKVPYELRSFFSYNIDCNSIWVLMINGPHISEEEEITKSLLFWKEFSSRKEADIRCLLPNQEEFNYFMRKLELSDFPVLLISDEYDFSEKHVAVKSQFLLELSRDGNFDKFLNKIHSLILQKGKIDAIESHMKNLGKRRFFGKLWNELKGLMSFKGTADFN